jgi:hypothetical protein
MQTSSNDRQGAALTSRPSCPVDCTSGNCRAIAFLAAVICCAGVELRSVAADPARVGTSPPAVPVPNQYYRTNSEVPNMVHTTKGRRAILHKLNLIRFDEVFFDGVPLPDVVKFLGDESRKRDPERKGLNFLINSVIRDDPRPGSALAQVPGAPVLDAAGNPVPAPAAAPVAADLDSVLIRTSLPVRDVSLAELLDLITKLADSPMRVSVEDYAVVFVVNNSERPPHFTRVFRVDPNTFVQGLQGVTFFPVTAVGGGTGSAGGGGGGPGSGVGGVGPGGVGGAGGGGIGGSGGSGGGPQLQSVTVPTVQTNQLGIVRNFFFNAGVRGLGQTNSRTRVQFDGRTGMVVVSGSRDDVSAAQNAIEQVNRGERVIRVPSLPATTNSNASPPQPSK